MTLEPPITTDQLRGAAERLPKPTADAATPHRQAIRGGDDILDAKVQVDAAHTPATWVVFELVPDMSPVGGEVTVPTHAWRFTGHVQMDALDREHVTADNPLEDVVRGVLTQAGAYDCNDSRIISVHVDKDRGDGLVTLTVLAR